MECKMKWSATQSHPTWNFQSDGRTKRTKRTNSERDLSDFFKTTKHHQHQQYQHQIHGYYMQQRQLWYPTTMNTIVQQHLKTRSSQKHRALPLKNSPRTRQQSHQEQCSLHHHQNSISSATFQTSVPARTNKFIQVLSTRTTSGKLQNRTLQRNHMWNFYQKWGCIYSFATIAQTQPILNIPWVNRRQLNMENINIQYGNIKCTTFTVQIHQKSAWKIGQKCIFTRRNTFIIISSWTRIKHTILSNPRMLQHIIKHQRTSGKFFQCRNLKSTHNSQPDQLSLYRPWK